MCDSLCRFFFVNLVVLASAQAAVMLTPAGASTDMGSISTSSPNNVINQTGLSVGYTSMVTDFDTYIASAPTHDIGLGPDNGWGSTNDTAMGNFDFDLGGAFTIDSFVLWNLGSDFNDNLTDFRLVADDNSSFSSPIELGVYSANPNTGPASAVLPEVFTFAATTASYVRMEIMDNNTPNSSTNVIIGEAAFRVVPEPSSSALLGISILGGAFIRRRKA